jgi:hypothetical protein
MLGAPARPLVLVALAAVGIGGLTASASARRKPTRDVTPPTVAIEQSHDQSDPSSDPSIRFTATFSERVTGFTGADVAVGGTSGGPKSVTVSSSRDSRTFTVKATGMSGTGTVFATIPASAARDAAGSQSLPSTSTDNAVVYIDNGPTVTVDQASGQVDPTSDSTVHFTARFSEPVSNFVVADVTLGGTASASTVSVSDLGDHKRFDLAIGGFSSGGTVSAAVPAGRVTDGAGNTNAASTSRDGTVTVSRLTAAPPAPTNRVDLTARFGSDLAAALAWLTANPQPAIVTAGVYTTTDVLDVPAGADLVFQDATIIPTDPAASSIRLRGAGTRLTFAGICRIGAVGATNSRLGNAEAAGIELEGAYGFTITADDLTIEGVAQVGVFSYRGSHDGVIAGRITVLNPGADSFHVTDGSYNLDFRATLVSVGSGDDGFAVVSYRSNLVRVRNIHWHDVTVRNQRWGRGVSVVGGQKITVDHFDVDRSAGAGVYVAAEPQYDTFGVDGVRMSGKIRNPDTQHIHNANVAIYSAQPGQTITNVSVTVDADRGRVLVRKTGSYPVSKVFVNGTGVS